MHDCTHSELSLSCLVGPLHLPCCLKKKGIVDGAALISYLIFRNTVAAAAAFDRW